MGRLFVWRITSSAIFRCDSVCKSSLGSVSIILYVYDILTYLYFDLTKSKQRQILSLGQIPAAAPFPYVFPFRIASLIIT